MLPSDTTVFEFSLTEDGGTELLAATRPPSVVEPFGMGLDSARSDRDDAGAALEVEQSVVLGQVGAAIAVARSAAGLSQRELAVRAGMDRGFLNRVESGHRNPTVMMLVRIARAMNTTAAALLSTV